MTQLSHVNNAKEKESKFIPREKKAISKILLVGIIVLVVAAAGAVIFFEASSSGSSSTGNNISCALAKASGPAVQISIYSGASSSSNPPGYVPDQVLLVIGNNNTVTWTNNDAAHHTVTTSSAPPGASFNSGDMASGTVYTCTFSEAGTYHYYCKYHSWMTGTIVVENPATP